LEVPLLTLLTSAALACGGLMCDAGPTPVVQNAERIAFLVDEAAGEVEAHVQIFYEGPPDAFAWVVPVAAVPEVFLSSESLFSSIATGLAPQVQLVRVDEGTCKGERQLGCLKSESGLAPNDFQASPPNASIPNVAVIAEGQVGPYDHAVLQASDEGALISWLQGNGYDVPSNLSPLLAPYLVDGGHFVAIRLQKDRDTGDIAPLGFRYRADRASIPIQLTALASAPDLRLEVSVFAQHRAVPESYLHVTINEANLDWFGGGQNYYDVVSRAADQAGGHAFATDYAGTATFLPPLWTAEHDSLARNLETLADAGDAGAWADALERLFLPVDANAVAALAPWVELSLGATLRVDAAAIDVTELPAATEALERYVFEPRRRADRLFDQPWVTRLSSSLDAEEMTVDPVFVTNADLPEVSNLHVATLVTECDARHERGQASRRLELSDGRMYRLPSALSTDGDDSTFWAQKHSDVEALRIERTGPSGLPEVIADFTDELFGESDGPGGVGCQTAPGGAFAIGVLLALAISRRRKAAAS
jgi:uncharacterized protein (TIGR03382 family)